MKKIRRRHILLYIIILSFISLFIIFQSYDEFARNSSINDSNRLIIKKYLSEEEKKFLIDNNINVNKFLPFITYEGFKLMNYEYYDLLYNHFKDEEKLKIISSANFFVDNKFTLRSLDKIFENEMYSINQLVSLVENNQDSKLNVEFYPKNWNALSNFEYTIQDFKPNDLVNIDSKISDKNLYIRKEANDSLNLLCDEIEKTSSSSCKKLEIENAFISYNALKKSAKKYPSFIKPGQSDFQLGNTISFKSSSTFYKNSLYTWLKENSYKYGFVLRYPNEKVELTKVKNQYGVFRYVGIKQALRMFNENKVIEEMR